MSCLFWPIPLFKHLISNYFDIFRGGSVKTGQISRKYTFFVSSNYCKTPFRSWEISISFFFIKIGKNTYMYFLALKTILNMREGCTIGMGPLRDPDIQTKKKSL